MKHLYFFDKNGKNLNFDYNEEENIYEGDIFLNPVSTGLFEVGQIFILQEFLKSNGLKMFGYPHSISNTNWLLEWETTDPVDIFLFQFDRSFISGVQSSLSIEVAGPSLERYEEIEIPLDYDVDYSISESGHIITNNIRSETIQINFAINSFDENTFKRTLLIRDLSTSEVICKFTVYAETIAEDERLKTITENLGYNITLEDSSIFRDTNIIEQLPNFIEVNRKRKEIIMEGSNIYPFIGSYKGLINAIKFFGYDNLQVKEFWKNINPNSSKFGKYIQSNPIGIFNPKVDYNDMTITLPNKNFRKTNLFSLVYRINKIREGIFDFQDLPLTEEVFDFTIEEVLIKLFGLKRKLEKDFLPLNARIVDIIGEADFFGLAEVTNTISRNNKSSILAGIDAKFKVTPDECTYLEDLRSFADFCFKEEAIVNEAIIEFCNAYVAPLDDSTETDDPVTEVPDGSVVRDCPVSFSKEGYFGPGVLTLDPTLDPNNPIIEYVNVGTSTGQIELGYGIVDGFPNRLIIKNNSDIVLDLGYRGDASYNNVDGVNVGGNRHLFTSSLDNKKEPITEQAYPILTDAPSWIASDGYPFVNPVDSPITFQKTAYDPILTIESYISYLPPTKPTNPSLWSVSISCPDGEEVPVNPINNNQTEEPIDPLPLNSLRNLVLGPYESGDQVPRPPIGPDFNNPLGQPFGGNNFTISEIADVFLAYFSRYGPNLNRSGHPEPGESSRYLPDKPGIPVGALVVLENDTFGNINWNESKSTYDELSNASSFHTFDLVPQGIIASDIFKISDPITGIEISYEVQAGDDNTSVVLELFNLITDPGSQVNGLFPWRNWDISIVTLEDFGDAIRIFGANTQIVQVSVESQFGSKFLKFDSPGENLYAWDSVRRGNFIEIEWTIFKPKTEISPEYFFNVRGSLNRFERFPIVLPYVGEYIVEMKLYDLYNNVSSIVEVNSICVDAKEVEYSGWYQARKLHYTWQEEGSWKWNDYGSIWNLPIEPSVTWEEETPSLYESLDRVNAILNNFGLGTSPDFTILNFQDDGEISFMGPYFWSNLNEGNWNDSYHLWWEMTSLTGDTPAFFQFKEFQENSYLKIIDLNGDSGTFFFDSTITSLTDAANALNLSNDPVINKYIYNIVYDSENDEKFIQAVSRYFGVYGDWDFVGMVDVNDELLESCYDDYDYGCESLIYRKGLHKSSNPTWSTAKFINEGVVLPKLTWIMFVYDKCKISGKDKPKWTIKNKSKSNDEGFVFESKYLTYLFKESGNYEITLELEDSNRNKYKKSKNILIIK